MTAGGRDVRGALLSARRTGLDARAFVADAGECFAIFDERTQDSGNVSYGVHAGGKRYFVKTAGAATTGRPLPFDARVALLRNAIRIHRSTTHAVLAPLRNVVEAADGPVLVYDWVEGESIGAAPDRRADPASAFLRFRRLPAHRILVVLDEIIDLHDQLASAGWIAVDFYDGSILHDFITGATHIIDIDHYHRGAFVNRMGRMFGSTRFMAPEEFRRDARITERTTVFTLGRTVVQLLSEEGDERAFRGAPLLLDVVRRACAPGPRARYATVKDFADAWRLARASIPRGPA